MTSPIFSTMDDDILVGTEGPDFASGQFGNDVIVGAKGQDTLIGDEGNDIIIGGGLQSSFWNVSMELSEEDPSGIAYFNRPDPLTFAETLKGNAGNDVLIGGSWHDINENQIIEPKELSLGKLEFQESWGFNNVIWGGSGDDQLYGADGFDTLGGGAGDDLLYGYGGVDRIYGGAGNDTIAGGAGEPELFHREEGGGGTRYEELYGGDGNDEVSGGEGADMIFGGAGSDMLSGGEGNDTLSGGAGSDVFNFTQGMDVISDFSLTDDTLGLEFGMSREQYKEQASNTTINGQEGLLITIGEGEAVFLVGISLSDFDDLSIAL